MTPAAIIQKAQADGLILALSPSGTIKAVGTGEAVNRWLPLIRQHKAGLLKLLRAASEAAAIARNGVSDPEELEVVNWLECILEDDLVVYSETLTKLRVNPTYRAAFLSMARGLE